MFLASPVLRVPEGHKALEPIVKIYHLTGLSYREYLNYTQGQWRPYTFDELIQNHVEIARSITGKGEAAVYFDDYLRHGYYPYFLIGPVIIPTTC